MKNIIIEKRNGSTEEFNGNKIKNAIMGAYQSIDKLPREGLLDEIVNSIYNIIINDIDTADGPITVSYINDLVPVELMKKGEYEVATSFISYRTEQAANHKALNKIREDVKDTKVIDIIRGISKEYKSVEYSTQILYQRFNAFTKPNMSEMDYLDALIKVSSELTSKEAPFWENISAKFVVHKVNLLVNEVEAKYDINSLHDKVVFGVEKGLYHNDLLKTYSKEDFDFLESKLNYDRDNLFNYSGIDIVMQRYLKRYKGELLERPQEWLMLIAMHIGVAENQFIEDKKITHENRLEFIVDLYDILSELKTTMATPTLTNARTPFSQLSSCFIDTVDDSLDGIYKSLDNFAQVSKHGGGMGKYYGKIRASGSDIRGVEGAAGGIVRWIRLANDTAVAVDQLGQRQGAVAVYLDVWHKDMPEFLDLRTNNGDDRMKAHDVFPAVSYPRLFWELAEKNINSTWYMFDPKEIEDVMGYRLEDYYGDEWEKKYNECIMEPKLSRRTMTVKDMVRLIIKSLVETGTPFSFFRDEVNELNPNKHKGMVYSSNLCTEILQNMSPLKKTRSELVDDNGTTKVIEEYIPGDFVVCNLASLVLGNINLEDDKEVEKILTTVVRALDNVIDINYYPIPFAEKTNKEYRAIGIGSSGYHHALVQQGIMFSSEEHLEYMDKVYEKINYYAIKASSDLATVRGSYKHFKGSDWETGDYFDKRDYTSDKWKELKETVKKQGLRNGYLMAIAPTGSTSIISGSSAGVDPIMKTYFLEEKKGSIVPRVAPELTIQNFWLYESAHKINQEWVVRAAAIRQRHIDQSQSVNLYITPEYTMRQIMNLLIMSNKLGVKTLYYTRSQSLEVDECDSCSA